MEKLKRIPLWIVAHPVMSLAIILAITAFFALQIPRLEIDASSEGLMVEKDPARVYYDGIKKKFGSDNLTIVVIKAQDVFTPEVLGLIQRLSIVFKKTDGVSRVESLTSVNNIKGEPNDVLNTDPLVPSVVPKSQKDLAKIKSDALGNRIFLNNIVSADGKTAAINVYTDPKPGDKTFNSKFSKMVDAAIVKDKVEGVQAYQIGAPLIKVTLGEFIQGDMQLLIPMAVVLLLLILYLSFRTLQGCMIPAATGLVSIIWVLGEMVLIGYPLNVITVIIPALMVAIGFTEDSHMISEFHNELEHGLSKLDAVKKMAVDSALPILITTFTTVVGFGSLITSDITMLIQFGVASALGLTSNWIISSVLVPVILLYWPLSKSGPTHHASDEDSPPENAMTRFLRGVGDFNIKYRWPITTVVVVSSVACIFGWAWLLKVNTDFVAFFREDTFVRKRVKDVHESMAGVINFYVVVETGKEDGAKEPEVLRAVAGLQDFLKTTGKVDNTISLTNYLRTMHKESNQSDPKFDAIPDKRELVAQYLLTLEGPDLAKYVDHDYSTLNLLVRHSLTASWDLSTLLSQIRGYVDKNFPKTVKVVFTGEGILINNAADFMASNQVEGFGTTFLIIGVIHAALFMSMKAGFISLLPNVVPILFNFGLMGFFGIPLNVGTSLIAAIALGIAVDDTVHFMVRYSRELNAVHDQQLATNRTVAALGRPVIYSSLALAGGFGILAFSNFIPTMYFGVLSAIVMLVAMGTELTISPILMVTTRLVTVWDTLLAKMNKDIVATTPIFRNFWLWEAKKVAVMGRMREHKEGEKIVTRGDVGREMFLVISGKADVQVLNFDNTMKTIKVLEAGDIFGEMAIVEQLVRTADVVAVTDVETLSIDADALERLRQRFPYTAAKLFLNLAKIISARLRETTETLRLHPR